MDRQSYPRTTWIVRDEGWFDRPSARGRALCVVDDSCRAVDKMLLGVVGSSTQPGQWPPQHDALSLRQSRLPLPPDGCDRTPSSRH